MRKIFSVYLPILILVGTSFYAGKITSSVHYSTLSEQVASMDNASFLDELEKSVDDNAHSKELREALIVRLANKAAITMYGRQINDNITDKSKPGRKKYDLHPYGKTGSGAQSMVVYTDKKTKNIYVLLGRKYKNYSDKSQGLADQIILFGGYMKPHSLEGGEQQAEGLSEDEKDRAEEAILLNKEGYKEIASKNSAAVKEIKNESENYDYDLEHTAIRELKEEAGIWWDVSSRGYPVHLSTRSAYGITNDKRLHTIVGDYLFDFGTLDLPPPAQAGSDIAEVVWVKLSDIIKNSRIEAQEYGSEMSRYGIKVNGNIVLIRDDHGEVIENYAKKIKNAKI